MNAEDRPATVEERLDALELVAANIDSLLAEVGLISRAVVHLRRAGLLPLPGERVADLAEPVVASVAGTDAPASAGVPAESEAAAEPTASLLVLGVDAADQGRPTVSTQTPAAWRARPEAWRRRAWEDLGEWMGWLLAAYRLHGSGEGWGQWWTSRGAIEELVALREWHRELVDVTIAESAPHLGIDTEDRVAMERAAQRRRLEHAQDRVVWHDALERVARRVAGSEGRDLVSRQRALDAPASARRTEELARQERDGFAAFLRQLEAAGEIAPTPTPAVGGVS